MQNIGITIFLLLLNSLLSSAIKIKVVLENPQKKIFGAQDADSMRSLALMVDGNGHYIYPEIGSVFTIPTLSIGDHNIEVISDQFLFPVLRLKKTSEGVPKMIWLNPLDRKYIKTVSEPEIRPLDRIRYFEPESSFNLIAFMTSGTGLMIMMGVAMVVCYKGLNKVAESQVAPPAPRRQ